MHQLIVFLLKDVQVPCIGVATHAKVSHNEVFVSITNGLIYESHIYLINQVGGSVNYTAEKKNDAKSASLQQDHTHFILVKSKKDDWGQEIEYIIFIH